ncbi:MAG: hypothetical protein HC904_13495 [Blastochloris sp.]|nr:hypothetical protein [Blastochloris sp.]
MPGTFQWDRGLAFLHQIKDPWGADIEPALRWRILPALVARLLSLEETALIVLPWLGVCAFLFHIQHALLRSGFDRLPTAFCVSIFASSSSVLVPLHWWGMNDAWAWLGLSLVSLGRSPITLIFAGLLTPWVDERFIIALPLALAARHFIQGKLTKTEFISCLSGPLIYLGLRLWSITLGGPQDASTTFVTGALGMAKIWIPFAPLGWWMAWRMAWFFPILALYACWQEKPGKFFQGLGLLLTTAIIMIPLAADLSRSAALILPTILAGMITLHRYWPHKSMAVFGTVALLNLFLPVAHVVYDKIDIISPLPIELVRWIGTL